MKITALHWELTTIRHLTSVTLHANLTVTRHSLESQHKKKACFAQMHDNDVVCLHGVERPRGMKWAQSDFVL